MYVNRLSMIKHLVGHSINKKFNKNAKIRLTSKTVSQVQYFSKKTFKENWSI